MPNPKLADYDYFQLAKSEPYPPHNVVATFEVTYRGHSIVPPPEYQGRPALYRDQKLGKIVKVAREKVTDWYAVGDPDRWVFKTRYEAAERLKSLRLFPKPSPEQQASLTGTAL